MTRPEIEQIVHQFLLDDLEIDEELIQPSSRLKEDMRIDSLDYVDIAVLVDQYFHFKIKVEEMKTIITLSDFVNYVESKMSK